MHMGTSLDCRDDWDAYVGYVFQSLNPFIVNLAPDAGIGGVAEGRPVDIRNELPTGAREDYDLVRAILRNPVEAIDKFRVSLRAHNAGPAVGMDFSNQHAFIISCQLEAVIGIEVVRVKCVHSIVLLFLLSSGGIELDSRVLVGHHPVNLCNCLSVSEGSGRIV